MSLKAVIIFHLQRESSYCPEKAVLKEADPGDLQIVCSEYDVDAIPEDYTPEKEKVLEIITIAKHPEYNPGTEEDFGPYIKGPFTGYDISVYHVNDTNIWLEEELVFLPSAIPQAFRITESR